MEGEMKERRKIQFSMPSAVPIQLDPKQVEMIRRRRPTPATLFRMTDHPSPEDENPSHQLTVSENGVSKAKRVNSAIYQPPSLKAVQKMVEAHVQTSETGHDHCSSESSDNEEAYPDPADPGRGEEDEGTAKEGVEKSEESTDNVENPPDDATPEQLQHRLVLEDTDEETSSTLLHEVVGKDNEEAAESEPAVNRSAEKTDNGENKEKGKD